MRLTCCYRTSYVRNMTLYVSYRANSAVLAKFMEMKGTYLMTSSISSTNHNPGQNDIIAALPAEDYARLLPDLELVPMPLGWALYEAGEKLSHAYFPVSSIVSLLYVMENGSSAEIAVTGFDGLIGIALFMGGDTMPSRAVVQSAGFGYRLRASVLKSEFRLGGKLQQLALSYTQAMITQMAQTAVCNRHHSVVQQLCRWLLLSLDLLPSNELVMTQELIADMLGVRRGGVTEAAGKLQAEGLIQYSRGHIRILDRPGLELRVCECYAVVKKEFDRLLPHRQKRVQQTHPASGPIVTHYQRATHLH